MSEAIENVKLLEKYINGVKLTKEEMKSVHTFSVKATDQIR